MVYTSNGSGEPFSQIRHALIRIMRITIMIDGSLRSVDHFAGPSQPFESAIQSFPTRIGNGR